MCPVLPCWTVQEALPHGSDQATSLSFLIYEVGKNKSMHFKKSIEFGE